MKSWATLLLLLTLVREIPATAAEEVLPLGTGRRKLIECSWTTPTPEFLRDHIAAVEAEAPYDGIRIQLLATGEMEGQVIDCQPYTIFSATPWKYEYFADQVRVLKEVPFQRFTDNFLMTSVCPGVADWFDDAAWASVCNNFGVMAKIAKETGMKGICFDAEQYQTPLFTFDPAHGRSYEDTLKMARQRGREWGEAIFREYPEITIFNFFWVSMNLGSAYTDDPARHLQKALFIPFINGVYDVLPPDAKIVDGHENGGYRATTTEHFFRLVYDVKNLARQLIDPVNQRKYRTQTQLAPAIYLDAFFVFKADSPWHVEAAETDRLKLFERVLNHAVLVSDEYIWTWGEQCRWWDAASEPWQEELARKNGFGNRWEENAPGLTQAIRRILNPADASGVGENRISAGDFSGDAGKDGKFGWDFWQAEDSHGDYAPVTDGSVDGSPAMRLTGVKNGCLLQTIPTSANRRYRVSGKARANNAGTPTLLIRWQDAAGKLNDDSAMIPVSGERQADGSIVFAVQVTAPPGSAYLLPLFGTNGAQSATDFTDFDDLQVYEQ